MADRTEKKNKKNVKEPFPPEKTPPPPQVQNPKEREDEAERNK